MSVNIISILPPDCLIKIFSKVKYREDILNCMAVNTWLREFIRNEPRFLSLIYPPEVSFPEKMTIKELSHRTIGSKRFMIAHIRMFLNQIRINNLGVFNCVFQYNPECRIQIKFGYGQVSETTKPDREISCLYVQKINDPHLIEEAFEHTHLKSAIVSYEALLPLSWELDLEVQKIFYDRYKKLPD